MKDFSTSRLSMACSTYTNTNLQCHTNEGAFFHLLLAWQIDWFWRRNLAKGYHTTLSAIFTHDLQTRSDMSHNSQTEQHGIRHGTKTKNKHKRFEFQDKEDEAKDITHTYYSCLSFWHIYSVQNALKRATALSTGTYVQNKTPHIRIENELYF